MKDRKRKIFVCYHDNCPDGFTAAWAAWQMFKNRAEYIPLRPDSIPERNIRNSIMYFTDICPRGNKIDLLKKRGNSVIVIDHHKSSEAFLEKADAGVFDLSRSGAALAWKYFWPGKKMPFLVRYVEDGDLWKFSLPGTREILSRLNAEERKFASWSAFARKLERFSQRRTIRKEGKLIRVYENGIIDSVTRDAIPVLCNGHRAYAANSAVLHSEIGNALLHRKRVSVAIIWSSGPEGVRVSLRSDKTVDVSMIAAEYGGGGHAAAAGFVINSLAKIPWKEIKEKKPIRRAPAEKIKKS